MEKKKFAVVALNLEHEIFVVYVAFLSSTSLNTDIYLFHRPQISSLIAKKAPTNVSTKYIEFTDIFISDLASKLPEHIEINNHAIELVNGQQTSYEPIYSLGRVELEILKTYIKTNPVNKFIRPFESPAGTPILFDQTGSQRVFSSCTLIIKAPIISQSSINTSYH